MTNLSEHFSLAEATASSMACRLCIDNSQVSLEILQAAKRTAIGMEKVRVLLGEVAIHIDSWIRCLELNRALHSKDTSQHILGEAVDFIAPAFGTPLQICRCLINNRDLIRFDQLILEHTWVHISFCAPGVQPRGHVLSLLEDGSYAQGLTNNKGVSYDC